MKNQNWRAEIKKRRKISELIQIFTQKLSLNFSFSEFSDKTFQKLPSNLLEVSS